MHVKCRLCSGNRRKPDLEAELQRNGVKYDVRKLNVGDFLWVAREKVNPVPGTHTHTHTHTHTDRDTHSHTHTHTDRYTLTLSHTHIDTQTDTHSLSHTHTHRQRHTLSHTHTQTDTHSLSHTHTHTHTHSLTHMYSPLSSRLSGQLRAPTGRELVLDYIIERKRMDDLCGSIIDGRFREQKVGSSPSII